MPELPEMLAELYEMVCDDEIYFDKCEHESPADTQEFCPVCFITNLYCNVSLQEPEFTEETSETQRETIQNLWEQYANG